MLPRWILLGSLLLLTIPITHINTLLEDYIASRRNYDFTPKPGSPWDQIRQNFLLIQTHPDPLSFYQQNKVYDVNPEQGFAFFYSGSGAPLRKERVDTSLVTRTQLNLLFQSAL